MFIPHLTYKPIKRLLTVVWKQDGFVPVHARNNAAYHVRKDLRLVVRRECVAKLSLFLHHNLVNASVFPYLEASALRLIE